MTDANRLQKCFTPSALGQEEIEAKVQVPYGKNWGTGSQQLALSLLRSPQSISEIENLLKTFKKQTNNYTQTLGRKKFFQSIPWLHAGLPTARKGALSKNLIATQFEP